MTPEAQDERDAIVKWLNTRPDLTPERDIANGKYIRGSTTHGEKIQEWSWSSLIAEKIASGKHREDE